MTQRTDTLQNQIHPGRLSNALAAYFETISQSKIRKRQRSAMRVIPHRRSWRKMPYTHIHHQIIVDHPLAGCVELSANITTLQSSRGGRYYRSRAAAVNVVEP